MACGVIHGTDWEPAGDIEMSKAYHEMTSAERIADRIARNRRIEEATFSGVSGLSLQGIVARLDAHKQRATCGAVAELVGKPSRGLMSGRARKASRIRGSLLATNSQDSRRGWPTGYSKNQIHPDCYRQILEGVDNIIDTGEALKQWISEKAPSSPETSAQAVVNKESGDARFLTPETIPPGTVPRS
jgi:hypothetical protein